MAFLSNEAIAEMGFKSIGRSVRISDKASIYDAHLISIGDFSRIDDFCTLSGRIAIGRNVHLAVYNNVAGGEPGVTFEDFSGLAYGCHVFAQSDDYSGMTMTNPTVPDRFKRERKAPIVIGKHSIVGTGSLIGPGVTLAVGTAVGALSFVSKNTEEWSIYVGSPAVKVKDRKRKLLELEEQLIRESG